MAKSFHSMPEPFPLAFWHFGPLRGDRKGKIIFKIDLVLSISSFLTYFDGGFIAPVPWGYDYRDTDGSTQNGTIATE